MSNDNTIIKSWNGKTIRFRQDSYGSLSDMAAANGKKVNDWLRLKSTILYLQEVEVDTGIPVSELVQVTKGGIPQEQGTWVHPKLIENFISWTSNTNSIPDKLYVIVAGFRFKIGVTSDIKQRVKSLQTGCPDKIKVLYCESFNDVCIEKKLHSILSEYKTTGEWFHFSGFPILNGYFPQLFETTSPVTIPDEYGDANESLFKIKIEGDTVFMAFYESEKYADCEQYYYIRIRNGFWISLQDGEIIQKAIDRLDNQISKTWVRYFID